MKGKEKMNLTEMFMMNRVILDEIVDRVANEDTNFDIESEYGFTPTCEDAAYIERELKSKYGIDDVIINI